MMEHFVTLFDSLFLPQGLALHLSMERHVPKYTLWILCMDLDTHEVLRELNLPNVKLLALSDLENDDLLRVKKDRSKGEYCWTLTPFAPRFVFDSDSTVERATYIDADLWFRKNPAPIFREFEESGKQVFITDHGYAPEYDQSATSGQYCVQFMVFTRHGGEVVRKWWEERCVEWCYNRLEDGKFGDQKYLDNWPELFSDLVHVAKEKEWFLAPWNATRFPYSNGIVWHFHSARVAQSRQGYYLEAGNYILPVPTVSYVYRTYFRDISFSIDQLIVAGRTPIPQVTISLIEKIKRVFRPIRREIVRFKANASVILR